MKNAKYVSFIMLVALVGFMGGCTNKYEELCDDLDKITDPAQRERLSKECNLPMPNNTAEPTSQNSTPAQPPVATQQNSNYSYATPEKKRQSTIKKSQGILWGPGGMHP